jgi:hypothetical protein
MTRPQARSRLTRFGIYFIQTNDAVNIKLQSTALQCETVIFTTLSALYFDNLTVQNSLSFYIFFEDGRLPTRSYKTNYLNIYPMTTKIYSCKLQVPSLVK